MLNVLLCLGLTLFFILSVTCFQFMLGPGQWLVLNIRQCENPEQYNISSTITRRKLNRTHDCFHFILISKGDLVDVNTFEYGGQVDVYKEVDGGFKFFQSFSDPCGCKFLKKHGRENMERGLRLGGVDPPDCPINTARLEIKDFVMDYRELPKHGVYGTFDAVVYGILNGKKVGCIKIMLNFDNNRDDDYDD